MDNQLADSSGGETFTVRDVNFQDLLAAHTAHFFLYKADTNLYS